MKIDNSYFVDAKEADLKGREYRREFNKKYSIYFWIWFIISAPVSVYFFLVDWGIVSSFVELGRYSNMASILAFIIFSVPLLWYLLEANKMLFLLNPERVLLQKIAEGNSGNFQVGQVKLKDEKGFIFKQGNSRHFEDLLTFMDGDNKVRFFRYFIVRGQGKSRTVYPYHILSMETSTVFPHMYLNCLSNKYSMSLGKNLSLPSEFEKKFKLSITEGYHLEALQVFTPDVMSAIIDLPFQSDIEFVDNQMIFVIEGVNDIFHNFVQFEEEINTAKHIISLLKPKIENVRWSPVGNIPYKL